jgi:hypothetical protein
MARAKAPWLRQFMKVVVYAQQTPRWSGASQFGGMRGPVRSAAGIVAVLPTHWFYAAILRGDQMDRKSRYSILIQGVVMTVIGLACFALPQLVHQEGRDADPEVAVWLASLTVSGFVIGYTWPESAIRNCVVMVLWQPILVVLRAVTSEDLDHPSRSTGGLAGACIICALVIITSPLPFFTAKWGSRVRQWRRNRQRDRSIASDARGVRK